MPCEDAHGAPPLSPCPAAPTHSLKQTQVHFVSIALQPGRGQLQPKTRVAGRHHPHDARCRCASRRARCAEGCGAAMGTALQCASLLQQAARTAASSFSSLWLRRGAAHGVSSWRAVRIARSASGESADLSATGARFLMGAGRRKGERRPDASSPCTRAHYCAERENTSLVAAHAMAWRAFFCASRRTPARARVWHSGANRTRSPIKALRRSS